MKITSDRDIIRSIGTRAPNYDLTTQDIIDRLDLWTTQGGKFIVVGAGRDWIEFDIEAVPGDNICAFAVQVFLFCPDSLDQGVGSTREENAPEFFAAARTLCPGEPPGLRQATAGWWDSDPEDGWIVTDEYIKEAYLETEMGVKLIAQYLSDTRPTHLWWD